MTTGKKRALNRNDVDHPPVASGDGLEAFAETPEGGAATAAVESPDARPAEQPKSGARARPGKKKQETGKEKAKEKAKTKKDAGASRRVKESIMMTRADARRLDALKLRARILLPTARKGDLIAAALKSIEGMTDARLRALLEAPAD